MVSDIQKDILFRIARVGRGRWLVSDAVSDAPVASFDGWRAAREHVKQLTRARAATREVDSTKAT